jgi:hypothetical protein
MQLETTNTDSIAKGETMKELLPIVILNSVDIESNFRLYSYRVIDTPAFIQRFKEIIEHCNQLIYSIENKY